MADRLMVFIDGANIYHSLKNECARTDLDFGKFVNCLKDTRELRRTYYYCAQVDQSKQPKDYQTQQRFVSGLRNIPYFEVRMGRLVYRVGWPTVPPIEKGIDVRLATDMVSNAYKNTYDIALLVSADADFSDALQAVKDTGKHVEVALFGPNSTSRQLRDVADRVVALNANYLQTCWKK